MPYLIPPKEEPKVQETQESLFRQIVTIPFPAWVLFFICMFFYVGVLTFNTVASQIMQNTGKMYKEETATLYLAIPMFVSVFASPCFGILIDRTGRALYWISLASTMMIISMLAFLANANEWVFIPPPALMVWQGIGYAMGAASIWPTLSHVVAPELLSTAYGAMTSIQNVGMAVFPLIIGEIQEAPSIEHKKLKYTIPILIFIFCEGVSLFLAFLLLGMDKKFTGGRMNSTFSERKAKAELTSTN